MFDKKMMVLGIGGVATMGMFMLLAFITIRKQTNKLRNNMRTVSRGIYNFGTALQLLSGAASEEECDSCASC